VVMTLAQGFAHGEPASSRMECTVVTETPANRAADSDLPFRLVRKPSLIELARLIRKSDLVHVAGPALRPLVIGFLMRKQVIVEHHGFQTVCPNGLLFHEPSRTPCPGYFLAGRHGECRKCNSAAGYWRSLKLWALTFLRRWGCAFAAANIAPTHWLARLLRLPRTSIISHGVKVRPYSPLRAGKNPTFAFVGRLVSTKGVDLLLHACRELSDKGEKFRLGIIGEGPERKALERLCGELGIASRVDFVGDIPEDAVEALVSNAIAVVIPSLAGEVFGLVAAESMMLARAVIVPEDGALAEVVGETGLKFVGGDAKSLAICMERLLLSPRTAMELGQRARSHSLGLFSAQRMLDQHWALYQKVSG
jgi:glycosyltransferase involved in cell wall biosynthesis